MRQAMIQNYNMNSVGVQPADFVIAPTLPGSTSPSSRSRRNGDYCREHDPRRVQQLKSMLSKLDAKLFV